MLPAESERTVNLSVGVIVPMPTRELEVSKSIKPEAIFKAVVEEGSVQVEAAPAERFKAPAEVIAKVPEVAVEMVKFPEVLVQLEVPPDANTNAPEELPILVVEEPVVLIEAVPVTVNPPEP